MTSTSEPLPAWAEELRLKYLRGEASQFVLHGNVYDQLLFRGEFLSLHDFLTRKLLTATKDTIVTYNPSVGVKYAKKPSVLKGVEDFGDKSPEKVLPKLEQMLLSVNRVAVIIDYAETVVPAGDLALSSESDRRVAVTLHRWSLAEPIQSADNIVILVTEILSELNPKLLSNPRVSAIRVPFPDEEERAQVIKFVDKHIDEGQLARLAGLTAGLKSVQIQAILAPHPQAEDDASARLSYITSLLKGPSDLVKKRAEKFAAMTQGMSRDEIRGLIVPEGAEPAEPQQTAAPDADPYAEVVRLVNRRKREIIEKECFGLVEFVEPQHDFSAVGGMEYVKTVLSGVANSIRLGNRNRVPMGILLVGPMGTGKTFLTEAFAKESGLTAIKFKNFRSKWVGSTESNLEKILTIVKALGNVLVIIDEGDRAFGNTGDTDGGTSSRVIARIKEFMSDTSNRGRILFILMTNRPDKLDIDIKRAGRLDRKIPFFYADNAEEIEQVLTATMRKNRVRTTVEFPRDRALSEKLLDYSNADLEAIALIANDYAHEDESADAIVTPEHLEKAITDYLPTRDLKMLEYMELQAVFEASNRNMLPKKYAGITVEELQQRLDRIREDIHRKERLHI